MEKTINILLFLLILSFVQTQLSEQEKQNLLKKNLKINNITNPEILFSSVKSNAVKKNPKYDPEKIKEIIIKYNFPENYSFIDDLNPPIRIKKLSYGENDFAFASTTALSYRLFKKGIDIELSAYYLITCYDKSGYTESDNLGIEFFLVKYGTVTEECIPSRARYVQMAIKECPSECYFDDDEFKKYRAKNPYSTTLQYKNDYYEVIAIIMEQLVSQGPVWSTIINYNDFKDLKGEKCSNIIYKEGENSIHLGRNAVVIVGYGYQDNKYYWIVQNFLGKAFCDNGFAKIEFGEINIEEVAFSEPY